MGQVRQFSPIKSAIWLETRYFGYFRQFFGLSPKFRSFWPFLSNFGFREVSRLGGPDHQIHQFWPFSLKPTFFEQFSTIKLFRYPAVFKYTSSRFLVEKFCLDTSWDTQTGPHLSKKNRTRAVVGTAQPLGSQVVLLLTLSLFPIVKKLYFTNGIHGGGWVIDHG